MLTHKSNTAIFGLTVLILLTIHYFVTDLPPTLFLLIFAAYFSLLVWGSAQISSNYHLKIICQSVQNSKKEIALTFDDGPDEQVTPLVLDILKKRGLKATFFCIGKKINDNESLIQRISDEGHLLANHSYSHSYFFDFFGARNIKTELQKTNLELERISGKKIKLFRPPYGVTTPNIAVAVESLQLTTIGWNIRSLDTQIKNTDKIFSRIASRLQPGSIILFHDTNTRIANVLEQTINHCEKEGFRIVPLDKLLKLDPYA